MLLLPRVLALPPWLPERVEEPLDNEEEDEETEEEEEGWPVGLLLFDTSPELLGGPVRWKRTGGVSGGHSFPSSTGGGPVRLHEADDNLSLGPLEQFFRAHLGAMLELLLLMR